MRGSSFTTRAWGRGGAEAADDELMLTGLIDELEGVELHVAMVGDALLMSLDGARAPSSDIAGTIVRDRTIPDVDRGMRCDAAARIGCSVLLNESVINNKAPLVGSPRCAISISGWLECWRLCVST